MFTAFFYKLRDVGIPVSPTSFLTLHRALGSGLVNSLDDFYTASRAILVKSERYFDLFDQVFAHHFKGADLPQQDDLELDEMAKAMLAVWLRAPSQVAGLLGVDESAFNRLSPDELIEYFKERLREQTEPHHRGDKWIGTSGTSPVGHSGFHPEGMRIGGISRNKSAVKVAMQRRYKDYSLSGPLTHALVGEALKRLRHLVPAGPKDRVNVEQTIYQTMKQAGEIEIIFERALKDRLKLILAIDNGGWSMDPHVSVVQTLFDYARSMFKDLKTFFFHNTIYSTLWEDPARSKKPCRIDSFLRLGSETRLIIVGDASMAPYELLVADGSIHLEERSGRPSIECLKFLAAAFPRAVWLNPVPARMWDYTRTVIAVRQIFPMFELTVDGLDKAVAHLMAKSA